MTNVTALKPAAVVPDSEGSGGSRQTHGIKAKPMSVIPDPPALQSHYENPVTSKCVALSFNSDQSHLNDLASAMFALFHKVKGSGAQGLVIWTKAITALGDLHPTEALERLAEEPKPAKRAASKP